MDILLIPGADGRAWYWHRLIPELAARGHRPIAPDMPDDPAAGVAEYTDAAVAALGGPPGDLAVVAQSLGGFVGPLVCARVPARVLILVNAMTPAPGESAGEWWDAVGFEAARAADAPRVGRAPDAEFDLEFEFFHDVPAEVTAEAMVHGKGNTSDAFFADPWPLDKWPDVPTRFLAGREDRFFPLEFQRRVVGERLGIEVEPTPGGHLSALSEPVALADAIDRIVGEAA